MNIKRAKQEIKNSIEAYLAKDEFGEYKIPAVRQRPVLLMGRESERHRSWSRSPENVRSGLWHIRSRTTRDKARWGFLLLRKKFTADRHIP